MTVSLVPLEQLTPAPWNPRHIDKARLKNLAESIRADPNFLLRRPILAQQSGEIYAGNQRWHAAKLLFAQGWAPPWQTQTVPVDLDDVPDQLARERALRDNNAWGAWDDDSLARLLGDLRDAGAETSLLGFHDRELSQLLARIGQELNPDDADLTPPVEPITKPGDLWLLGEHRLLCGDATDARDVELVLDGAHPVLLITDPPYGVEFEPTWRRKLGAVKDDYMEPEHDRERSWAAAWACSPGEIAYIWHSDKQRVALELALIDAGWQPRQEIVWVKQAWAMSRTLWAYRHEACLFLTRGASHWIGPTNPQGKNAVEHTTAWMDLPVSSPFGAKSDDPLDNDDDIRHAAQKPIALMRRPMAHHDGDVYEPFCGSGTTLIAAEDMGRRCFALELEPRFCDVAVRRWERVSGRQAYKKNA
jgi:DNA modification methylase